MRLWRLRSWIEHFFLPFLFCFPVCKLSLFHGVSMSDGNDYCMFLNFIWTTAVFNFFSSHSKFSLDFSNRFFFCTATTFMLQEKGLSTRCAAFPLRYVHYIKATEKKQTKAEHISVELNAPLLRRKKKNTANLLRH